MIDRTFVSSLRTVLVALALTSLAVGCGGADDAPDRYGLWGKVTFEGEPVPAGMIVFENQETMYATSCEIQNGYYENQDGKGHTGGKFNVRISGYESMPEGGLLGTPLWRGNYQTEIEIPAEGTEQDFDIKKSDVEAASADVDPAEQT